MLEQDFKQISQINFKYFKIEKKPKKNQQNKHKVYMCKKLQ